ncbi:MAG: GNAT family N-acetyltransferase [Propionibacteriaceae bacterium]|jgi:phosphinothricin acetyltransferase|nr:GNAT family N-acetyltransferase [Propionibacteriaceae bacterium]
MHIRPLLPSDWTDVSAVAREAASLSTLDDELTTWEGWDARFIAGQRLVSASREGRITGWAALEQVSTRPSWSGVAAVSVHVTATYRGQGFGSRLLAGIIDSSEEAGLWTLQAHVLPHNTAAQRLLESHGFRIIGTRYGLFLRGGVWQDAVLMDRRSQLVSAASGLASTTIPEAS